MLLNCLPSFRDQDVYIIGGGPSLNELDLSPLKYECTIACNEAFQFGNDISDVLIFGDKKWWLLRKESIFENFHNPIITNNPKVTPERGLICVPRKAEGYHKDALGWNGNTGSSAINLALILGAKRILLLGFDMKLDSERNSNWWDNDLDNITEEHYSRYMKAMNQTHGDIQKGWPGVKVLNLNPDSEMNCFPKVPVEEILPELKGL